MRFREALIIALQPAALMVSVYTVSAVQDGFLRLDSHSMLGDAL